MAERAPPTHTATPPPPTATLSLLWRVRRQQLQLPRQVYKGGTTSPFFTIRLFPLLLRKYFYVLSGVHFAPPKSAELVGRHSRPPERPRIAEDNGYQGYGPGAALFVPGSISEVK